MFYYRFTQSNAVTLSLIISIILSAIIICNYIWDNITKSIQEVEIIKNTFVIFLETNCMQTIRDCKTFITSTYSRCILLHCISA